MTTKCKKKTRVSKAQKELAKRYRCSYNYIFEKQPPWKKKVIIENNSDNHSDKRIIDEFISEVRQFAESNRQIADELNND
jgi:hypothetical protein